MRIVSQCGQADFPYERTYIYVPGEPEGTLTVEYLLEPGYKHLHNCKTNQTALIRKLMEVQRNGQ
jgi:hypothetical protein